MPWIRLVRAELSKLVTLPSVVWVLVLTPTCAALIGYALARQSTPGAGVERLDLLPGLIDYLVVGPILLGVMAACTEYETRQIRTTLCAWPSRPSLLVAKFSALALVGCLVSLCAVLAGIVTLGGLGEARLLDAAIGSSSHLIAMCLLSFAIGLGLRQTLAATTVALAVIVLAPTLAIQLPRLREWLPSAASQEALLGLGTNPGWVPAAILTGWLVASTTAASLRFTLADA